MKYCFLVLILFFCVKANSQGYITPSAPAYPRSTVVYEVNFNETLPSNTQVVWQVTGGTILAQAININNPITCTVQWDGDPLTPGIISVYHDLGTQFLEIQVLDVATTIPYLNFTEQYINEGETPAALEVLYNVTPGYGFFIWEKWDNLTSTWITLDDWEGFLILPETYEYTKYRVFMEVDGHEFTFESEVFIREFQPGSFQLTPPTLVINFDDVPPITTVPPSGGSCIAYSYLWEYSVENGPWFVIGSSENFPVNAPAIKGKTRIRRTVTCGNRALSYAIEVNPVYASPNYENLNYVRELTINKKGILSWFDADALTIDDKLQTTNYIDGLGRIIQKVDKAGAAVSAGVWKDLVKHIEYDAAGRNEKDFLPYATADNPGKYKNNAPSAQQTYTRNFFNDPSGNTYSLVEYDNSPLNRLLKSFSPGSVWSGAAIEGKEDFNIVADGVQIWDIGYSASALPQTSSLLIFPTGKLTRQEIVDELGNKIIKFFDLRGNTILKKVQVDNIPGASHDGWACTYYVYDDFGQLRFIIPPNAVDYLKQNNWVLTQTIVNELCFYYRYDEKGRLVQKKQPGGGDEKMVYDSKDRLVLTQHANQLGRTLYEKDQWSFFLYDDLNRTIATGLLHNNNTQEDLQEAIAQISAGREILSASLGTLGSVQIKAENAVLPHNLSGTTDIVYNSIFQYDSYLPISTAYNTNFTLAYSASDPGIEPVEKTTRITGMLTNEIVRVLDSDGNAANDMFLLSTAYYDEQGREIQVLSKNIKNGTDYLVNQYNFNGQLKSTYQSHTTGSEPALTIITKYEHDKLGRLSSISKNFNNTSFKILGEYEYGELGMLKSKRLSPGYTETGKNEIEKLTYNYNIKGLLTGINQQYALSNNNYTQWDHFFGMYIGYENNDNYFQNARIDGTITGVAWRSQGDNAIRKFDFVYDRLNRLRAANFKQKFKPAETSWLNTVKDFSTTIEYEDLNGNIKSLKNMGVMPGVALPLAIDDLNYTYKVIAGGLAKSNQLYSITDEGSLSPAQNGLLGDFKDGNVSGQDYFYDWNGNVVKDFNKDIQEGTGNGVTYNYLNKPDKVVVDGKSVTEYTYDAAGAKLKRKITYADNSIQLTTFIGDFVYENYMPGGVDETGDVLEYVLHEEGRLKIIAPKEFEAALSTVDHMVNAGELGISWPGSKQGVFEYFLKDHLGNTRMILTEQVQEERYIATMEKDLEDWEEPLFGQIEASTGLPSSSNELKKTRLLNTPPTPTVWDGNNTDVVKLNANDNKIGPNMVLKVMAGDIINTGVKYYYLANNAAGDATNLLENLAGSFINALVGSKASGVGKIMASSIGMDLQAPGALADLIQSNSNEPGSMPKAFLNIVFLDEQFKYIEADPVTANTGTGSSRVSDANNTNAVLNLQKKAPQNGWAFIYISNESYEPVYFDDLSITHQHGRIAEENHYYAFGQKISGISSRAFGSLKNPYLYQGDYSEYEEESGWNDFELRSYDAQIGRFLQQDPYDQFASGYIGMGNNPVNQIDIDGGWSDAWTGAVIGAAIGAATPFIVDWALPKDKKIKDKYKWALAANGALVGATTGYGLGAYFGDGNPFWASTGAFYRGILGHSGQVHSSFNALNSAKLDYAYIPEIWKGIHLPDISFPSFKLTNPFTWVLDFKPGIDRTLLAAVSLYSLINDPNVADGYPSYGGSINLNRPSEGNISVMFDSGIPTGYNLTQSASPSGTTAISISLMPDIAQILRDKSESERQRRQSGINLESIRRGTITNTVNANNQKGVKVYDLKEIKRPYKYLKIFRIKLKFIKKFIKK